MIVHVQAYGQGKEYLSDVVYKAKDSTLMKGYTLFGINYWRHDTSIFNPPNIERYNTSTGFLYKVMVKDNLTIVEILKQNSTAPAGKHPHDTFQYIFNRTFPDQGILLRTLLIREKYLRSDTFRLRLVDSFEYTNGKLIAKVFGKANAADQRSLKIYAYRSVDSAGSVMMHYWVERIGIVKLADEKCWRYSFEIEGEADLEEANKKMFVQIYKIIKEKYKDPYWPSVPCYFE